MTCTEKAQAIRWLRWRRDSYRTMARRPVNKDNGLFYVYHRIADAFHEEASILHHQLTNSFGPLPRFPDLC